MHVNNVAAIRIIAALAVLIRHSLILLGDASPVPDPLSIPPVGIWVFLTLSGYLLSKSWGRRHELKPYVNARVRRMVPALAVVVIATVFIVGPLLTTWSRRMYLMEPDTYRYLLNILMNPQYALPGLFEENPYASAVNGSLWSIPVQLGCCFIIPIVGLFHTATRRAAVWSIGLLACIVLPQFGVGSEVVIWGTRVSDALSITAFFCAGALIHELRLPLKGVAALSATLGMAVLWIFASDFAWIIASLVIPYVVLYVATRSTPILRDFGKLGDPSYGIFLVGFPVQQALILLAPELEGTVSLALTIVISVVLAYAIYFAIERPIARRGRLLPLPKRLRAEV